MREYHVYIMTNDTGSTLYTGVTNDIENRVHQHKTGFNTGSFTSRYRMTRLVYCESAGGMSGPRSSGRSRSKAGS